ncbi:MULTISPECIES: MDR family MFS transporter [Sutcliffiella]|uniref:Major facilitator superfamily (MFS) profile domain-containing protein n=1 Tax=Sutcliffiella cohnii TaxID=33932 RepID=A0A223KN55_9BACI|nr:MULTISPECIES: MFS transporter [Sutcliffiella]AST90912.1 hypothetical protein BC6307_06260 [Sutcliffiella cohnii]WBL16700.1 MFS transporter [Sutcliffiella sp. NC1]
MKFQQLHPNIKIRVVTDFITDIAAMSIIPFMAIYFAERIGPSITGTLLILNVLVSLLVGFYAGHLSDYIGRKKIMVTAQFLQVFSFIFMAIANSPWLESAWVTFAMFLLSSISIGMMNPAAEAMIVDASTKETRPYIYNIMYWSGNIAIAIGAVLGGLFFKHYKFALLIGFSIFSIITLFVILFMVHEVPVKREIAKKTISFTSMLTSYIKILKDFRFLLFSAGSILILTLEFQLDKYIAVRLQSEFFMSFASISLDGLRMVSIIIIINTALVVMLGLKTEKLFSRFKNESILQNGIIIYAIGFAILAFSKSPYVLIMATVLFTFGELLTVPIRQTMLATLIKDDAKGAYMAMNGLTYHIAMLGGGLGLIIGHYVSSYIMGIIFFGVGVAGLIFIQLALLPGGIRLRKVS